MSLARGSFLRMRGGGEPPARDVDPRNPCTIVIPGTGAFARPAGDIEQAFAQIVPRLVSAQSTMPHGALVAAVDHDNTVIGSVLLGPGEAITIGRHSECRLRLPDNDISLRHLAVHLGHAGDSPALLRAWDLATRRPCLAEDGVPTEAVSTDGPLFLTLGGYTILCVPIDAAGGHWPTRPGAAWRALPKREFMSRIAEGTGTTQAVRRLGMRRVGVAGRGDSGRSSVVTRTGSAVGIDQLIAEGEPAIAELILRSGNRRHVLRVGPSALERGILVGRYGRCASQVAGDDGVSRVHLLIAASGNHVFAIDTASSGGTWVGDQRIETLALVPRQRLAIGGDTSLRWHPMDRADT
jgi:hypothetical protein